MMKARWICVVAIALSGLSGCGKVDPTHPLDPETPIDFQRTSSVSGRVIVPTGADPTAVSSVTVHLLSLIHI